MIIWPLAFLAVMIALYAYIIRAIFRRRPAPYNAKSSLRHWTNRLAHVAK